MAERMMENDTRRDVYKIYKSGKNVFVRVGSKRCRSTTKHFVLTRTILKRYKDNVTYKVQLQMPGSKQISEHQFRIEDIADQPVNKKSNRRKFQEKLLISLTKCDQIEQFTEQGYNVVYDPPGDENCQFSALYFALRNIGLHRSPETLRREVVQHLNSNDMANGIPLAFFAGVPWEQYLLEMQMDGTYGDEITLRAISNILKHVEIIIVPTLGQGGRVKIVPEKTYPFARITLGHFAEGHGEHYVTLEELNEVSSESEVDITNFDNSAVENIDDENEDNNLEHPPEENINLEQFFCQL